ncbi:hypothetical protein BGZ97_012566, partial [Linnemannia gamsii]
DFTLVYAFQSWIQELKDQETVSSNSATTNASHRRVVVLGLTQDVRALDPTVATLLDDSIELDIPTPEERCSILQACAENHQMTGQQDFAHALKEVSLKCHGYLPADLNALCTRAAAIAHGHGRTYGPPGTGKTLLAKAVATESEANFMAVSIPELIKGEVGESEKAIAKVFKTASKCSPCIVFLDELEAIFGTRDSSGGLGKQLISQLLLEMDGCSGGVVILAATNHPEAIDNSILRPGRLDRLVYVPPPTLDERVSILRILMNTTQFSETVDLPTVGNLTNNFTGADMKALVRKAGLHALKDNRTQIETQDFFAATSEVQPSVNQFGLLRYEQFRRK